MIQTSIRNQIYKKGNPCPICNDTKASGGYCKTFNGLNYCINEHGRGHEAGKTIINGFAYLGDDKGIANLWSIWKIDEKRSEHNPVRAMLSAEEIEAARLAEIQARRDGGRCQGYLDAQLVQLRKQPLSDLAKADIEKRHLDPQDFFGTTEGKGLGYGAPIFDVNGQYKGYQYKVLGSDDSGYRWGNPKHHHNKEYGEQPLWVKRNDQPHEQLGLFAVGRVLLVEGTVAKPIALSRRMNGATVIGAAGGMFAISPETLKETLSKVATSGQVIEYAIDAGALENTQVLKQIKSAKKTVESLGWKFSILWWGQFNKADGDCDEIEEHRLRKAKSLSLTQALKAKPAKDWQDDAIKRVYQDKLAGFSELGCKEVVDSPGRYVDAGLLEITESMQLYFLQAPMGAGKTEAFKAYCEKFTLQRGRKPTVVSLTHRRSLVASMKNRLSESADLISYCIDSAPIALEDLGDRFPDIVIFDECDQLMKHFASQGTIADRVFKVIRAFVAIMDRANFANGTVIAAEAEISKPTYDFIAGFCPTATPTLVTNSYKRIGYNSEAIQVGTNGHKTAVGAITDDLVDGKTLQIVTSSLGFCKRLRAAIKIALPELAEDDVLIITSETSQSASCAAFLKNPTQWLSRNQPRIIMMSPAVESGISIEADCSWAPAKVYGFFNCGLPSTAAQQMMRLRNTTVDRVAFLTSQSSSYGGCARYIDKTPVEAFNLMGLEYRKGSQRSGSGETVFHFNLIELQKLAASYRVMDSINMKYFAENLIALMRKEGHTVTIVSHEDYIERVGGQERVNSLWEEVEAAMDAEMREECGKIKARDAMGAMMSDKEAEEYRMRRELTEDQHYALLNKTIRQHYGENSGKVLEDKLIMSYLGNRANVAIGLENMYLMQRPGIAKVVSRQEYDKYSEQGASLYGAQNRKMKMFDMAEAFGVEAAGKLQQCIESGQVFDNESQLADPDSLYNALMAKKYQIADYLGKDITYREDLNALGQVVPTNTPVMVVRWALSYLGLKLNCLGKIRAANGCQIRLYEINESGEWLKSQGFANPRFDNKYQAEAAAALLEVPPAHHTINALLAAGDEACCYRLVDEEQFNLAMTIIEEDYPDDEEDEGYDPADFDQPDW